MKQERKQASAYLKSEWVCATKYANREIYRQPMKWGLVSKYLTSVVSLFKKKWYSLAPSSNFDVHGGLSMEGLWQICVGVEWTFSVWVAAAK